MLAQMTEAIKKKSTHFCLGLILIILFRSTSRNKLEGELCCNFMIYSYMRHLAPQRVIYIANSLFICVSLSAFLHEALSLFDIRLMLYRCSAEYRQILGRLSADTRPGTVRWHISMAEYRSIIGRVSADTRPATVR